MANQLLYMPTPENYQGWTDAKATSELAQVDHEGIIRFTPIGKLPFEKARIVKNIISNAGTICSEDIRTFNLVGGTKNSATSWTPVSQYDSCRVSFTSVENEEYILSFKARRTAGSAGSTVIAHNNSASGASTSITITTTLQRFSVKILGKTGGGLINFGLGENSATPDQTYEVTEWQVENVTGSSQATGGSKAGVPSEYVSVNVGDGTELVTNGTFDGNDSTGWTLHADATCTNNEIQVNTTVSWANVLTQSGVPAVSGENYLISFEINNFVSGALQIKLGSGSNNFGADGTHALILPAPADNPTLIFQAKSGGFVGDIDNVSVQKVEGTGYAQKSTANGNTVNATTKVVTEETGAALSPVPYLVHVPAATNILELPIITSAYPWSDLSGGCTVTANTAIAPDGTYTAASVYQIDQTYDGQSMTVTLAASTDHTLSFPVKNIDAVRSRFHIYDDNAAATLADLVITWTAGVPSTYSSTAASNITYKALANDWYLVTFTFTTAATVTTHGVRFYPEVSAHALVTGVYAWAAQLEATSFATPIVDPYATVSKSRDDTNIRILLSAGSWYNASGAVRMDFVPEYEMDTNGDAGSFIETRNASVNCQLYTQTGGVIRSTDGSQYPSTAAVANNVGDTVSIGLRYDTTGNAFQLGKAVNGTWAWSGEVGYDGDFNDTGTYLTLFRDIDRIIQLHDIASQDAVATIAEIEAGLPVTGSTIKAISDTAAASDVIQQVLVSVPVSESGAGADQVPISVQVVVSETASAADIAEALILLQAQETALGADNVSITVTTAVAETATATDGQSVSISLQVTDIGLATDDVTLITDTLKAISDSATGNDALQGITAIVSVTENADGTDGQTINVQVPVSDNANVVDIVEGLILIAASDTANGADSVSITANIPVPEVASGLDNLTVQALVNVIESAGGTDVVSGYDAAVEIFSISFSLSRRTSTHTFSARSAVYSFKRSA